MPKMRKLISALVLAVWMVSASLPGEAAEIGQDHKQDEKALQDTAAAPDEKTPAGMTALQYEKAPLGKPAVQDKKALAGKAAAQEKKAPIVVEADEIYFSDLTGNMFAKGNAVITQDMVKLTGELIRGNAKRNEILIDEKATFLDPGNKTTLTGAGTIYNYATRTGTMRQANGKVGWDRISGQNIEILPDELIVNDGTMTVCPAQVPDYHVSATKVEIWPGDKLIAYNAKFWIKNTVIFSMAKYTKSLRDDGQTEFPRVGYSNDDGAYIIQHLEYPVGDKLSVYTDLGYYSKRGYRPVYGIVNRETNYSLSVVDGYFRDVDGHWIKKEPEFKFDFYNHRIGTSPVTFKFYATYGKWTDETKTDSSRTSWNQDYYLYFKRDPIKLNKLLSLNLGTGVERTKFGFNNMTYDIFRYDAALYQHWSPRFTTLVGYHYTKNQYTEYAYNNNVLARQLDLGFTYKIDNMNTIGFLQTYDVQNNRVYDQDITWYRNLHCWQANITYRAKRSQLLLDVTVKRF